MTQYEYMERSIPYLAENGRLHVLNELGDEGWEAWRAYPHTKGLICGIIQQTVELRRIKQ